jgi:hypothetical protein
MSPAILTQTYGEEDTEATIETVDEDDEEDDGDALEENGA